jgi:hypothetical protein
MNAIKSNVEFFTIALISVAAMSAQVSLFVQAVIA